MLDRLKEYKELITLVIFFLGGFWWIDDKYPKKADLKAEIALLQCLLDKYMTLTQYQVRGQALEKRVEELNRHIGKGMPPGVRGGAPALTPAMKQELHDMEEERKERQNDLKRNKSSMEEIQNQLLTNTCKTAGR